MQHVSHCMMWKFYHFKSSLSLIVHFLSGNSLLSRAEGVELHDASTWTWVEMSDAAVGMDKIAECPQHVAVQTRSISTCKTACQTNIITYSTCAVQADDADMLYSAYVLSHTEDKFSKCGLRKERTTCSIGKEHGKIKCIRNTLTNDTVVTNNSLKSHVPWSKGLEELHFPKFTPAQKSVDSQLKKISTQVRCDYKPEMDLKTEVKKLGSFASWLCSDKSDTTSATENSACVLDNFSTPAAAVRSCMSTHPTQRSTLTCDKHFTGQSMPSASKSLIQQITPTNYSLLNKCKGKTCNQSANQVENKGLDCSFSETRVSKRAKTSFVSKASGDLVTSNDSEATSSATWHFVSDSSPKKYVTKTCRASTSIILPSVEQQSPNKEYEFPTVNEKFKVVNTQRAVQAVRKSDTSRHAGQQRKLSKLEKFRRNLMKSRRPSKIAIEVLKPVKHRK